MAIDRGGDAAALQEHEVDPRDEPAYGLHRRRRELPQAALIGNFSFVKHAAPDEPAGDVGALKCGALGRRMRREIAGDGDENMATLVPWAPFAELPDPGLEHLERMKSCILAQEHVRQRCDQGLGRVAEQKVACDESRRHVHLSLTVKGVAERAQQFAGCFGQIIKSVAALPGQAGRRHIEIARAR